MSDLSFIELEYYFSAQRLHRYLAACAGDQDRAARLYKANIKISQAFHPLLGIFEVVLRNQINITLAAYFGDADWILNQRTGFMADASLGRGNFFLKREVDSAVTRLTRGGYTPITGKVIAELSFGFWTALFLPHHYRLVRGRIIKTFASLPAPAGRAEIFRNLTLIREFRNRISHNEPICFRGNTTDFTDAVGAYKAIRRTLRWIDRDLASLFVEFDSVLKEISGAKHI